MIEIEMNNFTGTGVYEISYNQAKLLYNLGDVILVYTSDSASTGTFTLTEYDESNNICSGEFSFTAKLFNDDSKEVTNGEFTVPIYK
jgi:hypothetical protein